MNAKEIIDSAIEQLDTYRWPDISKAQSLINSILEAAKLGSTGSDEIVSLEFDSSYLNIGTSYSCRGCSMRDDFQIPVSVIMADDPIKAAVQWAAEKELRVARAEVETTEAKLIAARERLQKAMAAMA